MKRSSRDSLVEATRAIALESGFHGLTFEALTARTGLTRSGIVYHFPLHELLVEEACKELAAEWDEELQQHLGKPFVESTPHERACAYLASSASPAIPGLLSVITDPVVKKLDPNPWDAVIAKWAPSPPSSSSTAGTTDLFVMRVIADGLAAYTAMAGQTMTPHALEAVLERTAKLTQTS